MRSCWPIRRWRICTSAKLESGSLTAGYWDCRAPVCFVGENVRYITSVFKGNWENNIYTRYRVLPPR